MTIVRVKGFQIFADRHGRMRCYSRSMAYYLLTAFVIGGALGVLHWAILGA
jgi:hypothetical protein